MLNTRSFPTAGHSIAFGVPLDQAIARMETCAQALSASAEKAPSRSESFGQQLKQAVKSKLRSRSTATTTRPRAEAESFGEKLKEAVKRKLASR